MFCAGVPAHVTDKEFFSIRLLMSDIGLADVPKRTRLMFALLSGQVELQPKLINCDIGDFAPG